MTTQPHLPPLDIDESMFTISGTQLFNRVRERMGWTDQYLKEINNHQHPLLKDIGVRKT